MVSASSPAADRTWKISSLSISSSQCSEKSGHAPICELASARGEANLHPGWHTNVRAQQPQSEKRSSPRLDDEANN
jgi:hypothetical protein